MNENELPVYKEKLGKKEWWIEVRKQAKNLPRNCEKSQVSKGYGF